MHSFRPKTILRKKPAEYSPSVKLPTELAKCTNEVRETPVTKNVTHPAPAFSSRFEKENKNKYTNQTRQRAWSTQTPGNDIGNRCR